ncbi:hypothetical protein PLICRDRAFT_52176 [Plicaturopsis crispa FD-325 SS-3]|nr:hypothetical protein PLICRDRAFT_52176 [Plicaturopsis crispa FD-325 SS-3]
MGPLKLAIVGAGPSAFYVASRILSLLPATNPQSQLLRIHMFDRLWAPHGLVRYGVAPDHPEVKNCIHKFEEAARDPRLRFFGNVNVGDVPSPAAPDAIALPTSSLLSNYSHLLLASGCALPTLHPMLPVSPYCIPALSLVHWYTHHPSRPPPPPLENISHVTLIGQGNVSLDIARILLSAPSELAKYDIPEHVLDVLSRSAVKHVSIVGRRGPLEAAFTTKELREMMNLSEASMVPIDPAILATPPNLKLSRQQSRTMQLLQKGSQNAPGSTSKTWSLEFFRAPAGLTSPTPLSPAQLTLTHTTLDPESQRAAPTDVSTTLSTDLVVTSLGFHPEPTSLFATPTVRTLSGRVVSPTDPSRILKNVYASGWAATGAKGVLASTMINAYAVADQILSDWLPKGDEANTTPVVPTSSPSASVSPTSEAEEIMNSNPDLEDVNSEITAGIADGVVTEYGDWKAVDAEEVRRGETLSKERERMGWENARTFLRSRA